MTTRWKLKQRLTSLLHSPTQLLQAHSTIQTWVGTGVPSSCVYLLSTNSWNACTLNTAPYLLLIHITSLKTLLWICCHFSLLSFILHKCNSYENAFNVQQKLLKRNLREQSAHPVCGYCFVMCGSPTTPSFFSFFFSFFFAGLTVKFNTACKLLKRQS